MHKQIPLAISSDADLTFDNFYQADSQQPVIAELKKFARQDAAAYHEPFVYLWGSQGCGLSHLLNATQNYYASPLMQYLPLKELINYSPVDILEGLEDLDLVCIDDIDCLSDSLEWQERVFYLFNRLRDSGKKLLVGGHAPPAQLSLQLPDLQSRLQWGVTLYVEPLSDADKQQAIQFYAQSLGMQLSDEVASYLLQRTDRSSQALFKLVRQLDHASLAEQRKLTIPFVKTQLN